MDKKRHTYDLIHAVRVNLTFIGNAMTKYDVNFGMHETHHHVKIVLLNCFSKFCTIFVDMTFVKEGRYV